MPPKKVHAMSREEGMPVKGTPCTCRRKAHLHVQGAQVFLSLAPGPPPPPQMQVGHYY